MPEVRSGGRRAWRTPGGEPGPREFVLVLGRQSRYFRAIFTQVALGVLAVASCLGAAFSVVSVTRNRAQSSVVDFHTATKCIDQCSSKDDQGVEACEKHYQMAAWDGCDAKQYGSGDADDLDIPGDDPVVHNYHTECHGLC